MNPMIYLHLCLTNRHLKLLLFVVACLLGNFSNTLAQTVLNCPSGGGIVAPIRDYVGDGHLPYRFHHKDGTYNNIFYRDETIYSYGVTSNGTCRAPNSSLFRTPIMPSAFTSLCTPANNPFFFSLNNVSDIIQKKCQMVFTTQYVYSRVEHFHATVTGDFNIAYNNSNGTTVNLTILDRYALYTDYGNLSGNYNETGTRNGKKKFVDSDGNELYYDATNAQWVVSGSTGIAYSVASTADAPPLTGWQIVANDCIGRNLKVVFGEYTPNFNITYTLDNTCKPEYNGVYKSTGILNNRPFLTGPNNHRIWFNETTDRQLWQIDNGGLYYVGSSITVPVNWRRDAECIVRESSINVVIGPERIVLNPITICVKTLCGNYEGIYTPKTLFNERPDLKDDDNNRLFYWGGGDPTHPEGWYIADANNKYVFYNSSNAESVPTTGWQAFTGDGITCTNNIGVFENECQPCPTYSVESIAYGSASYCKSTTEATVTITGSAGGVFTSTQGLSIDANSGTINPSTSTAGTYTITYSLGGTNGCVLTTATASVTIEELKTPSVSISANPSGSITAGTSVTFTATPTNGGATPSYVWKKNDAVIPNETGATLTTTTLADGDKIKVEMTSSDVCASSAMATSTELTMAVCSLPTAYNVTGGGAYCSGSGGSVVGLSSSQTGVNYQLKRAGSNVGSAVAGTGSAISFGNQTEVGTYTVEATSVVGGCTTSMTGSASVTTYALPTAVVSGTSLVCKGGSAVPVTFTGSNGVAPYTFSYQVNGGSVQMVTMTGGSASVTVNQSTSTEGVYTYTLVSVRDANCSQTQSGSAEVKVQSKPTIVLNTLQQTLNEGNTQVFCDTDANPENSLQFVVSGACVVGNPVWRVQVGSGSWSEWSATAPVSQLSNNQPHRYQAACDVSCPVTYTSPIELTINYRASVPQNVSLLADGVTVAAGETKEVCSLTNSPISFTANCGAGELLLYSVDGGEYSAGVPLGLVDNQFHNYRVRCRKSDGTSSCVESESGVMRLKLVRIPAAPTVSLSPATSCNPSSIFSGQSSCGSLQTVWYNATTNVALSTLPSTVPSETTSYYARCQTENGCVSEKSNVVTFTVTPVHVAPIVTVSQEIVCTGTTVTVSANCPVGSTTSWNTGITTPSFEVAFSNVTKQSYWAKCVFEGGCQSAESNRKEVSWKAFVVSLINIGASKSATKVNDRAAWSSQFITRDGGPELVQSTQQSPTLYYVENVNKMAPRYWTIHADACALGTNGSLTFDMLATPEMGVIRSFNTHENNAPYFMYANREGWTELYGPNHPAYGFYEDNGSGGNVYDAGLPKGLYKLSIRYWDMKGWGSIYPSTRKPQGNVLAYQEYWFRIQSKDGVGVGAAREMANGQEAKGKGQGSDNGKQLTDNGVFATVLPNPVTNTLRLRVQNSKWQMVQTSLTDAAGREVLSRQFTPETNTHQEEFGVSELPTGMYFLKVTTPDKQATLKVVKVD